MTSTNLSPKQLNFAQISIVCVDILRQCLIDILDIHIKPTDLSKEIHLSQSLKGGKDKLNSEQRDLCCFSSLGVPDYNKFDVTLLYRLIRNLCPTLKPSKDWGKEPKTTDLKIGDDIERIRLFRNKHYAHAESAKIPDSEFKDLWNEGKSLIHRIQIYTTTKGRTTDYGLKLTNISGRMIKYEEYTSYVNLFRAISIEKHVEVTCGDTAHFKADIRLEESAFLSVSWEKVDGPARKHIDLSCEKYKGSTGRQLNIHSVCKEDEGEYQAVISRNLDHKIFSNIGFLQTQGELPQLDNLKVSTTKEEICIHYSHRVPENSPRSNDIKWTKNKTPLDLTNNKYCGGNLDNSVLKITCPTKEDRGEYSCTVSNAVGSVSRVVILDEPSAKISTNTPVVHGSETRFSCLISSCPSPEQIEWQKSCDENIFYRIDIRELKYHGSNENPSSPVLCLPKTTFDDQQFYRIVVRNKIGEYTSDTHFLEVTGNRPNISNATCTTKDRSVRLNCDVYLYDKSPALQDVYWTKNEQRLDIQGSGGKYSGVSLDDPSLTINNVNEHDAGNYQLTAINSVGPTKSDDIVLGVPDVVLERTNKNEDGSHYFMVTIKSNPAPFFVKWSMKDKESETLQQININSDEYKGTSTSFPHPMLVVKNPETLENYCFQIEAKNVIGFTEKVIPDETNPVIRISDDNTVENLNRSYERGSRNIMFGKVFDELAEQFPEAKIGRLKDLIQNSCEVEDVTSLKQANSARDCFRILKSENIFTPEDVIFVQYLLKMTECDELETKCIEYAKKQNARYYYEKPPDNGYKNVHFHVVANIGCYRTENITKVRETVAAIVGCTIDEVLEKGYLHSASFILVLSIKNNFVYKLLALERKDKDKLSKLSIDYFKIDSTIIHLKGLRDETNPNFFRSDDNTVNVGNLIRIYERRERNIRFQKDCDELAKRIRNAKFSRLIDRIQEKDTGGNDKGSSEKKEKVKPKSKLKEEEETMKIIFNETTENLKKLSLPDVNVKCPPTCNKIMQENQGGKPQKEKDMESRGNLKEDTVFDDSRPERGGRRQEIAEKGSTNTSVLERDADKKDICPSLIPGSCREKKCDRHHTPLPYLWQIRIYDTWVSFNDEENEKLERGYCNLEEIGDAEVEHKESKYKIRMKFNENIGVVIEIMHGEELLNTNDMLSSRRLSTASFGKEKKPLTIGSFHTQWRWYFWDDVGQWVPFDKDRFQYTLEKKYVMGQKTYLFTRENYYFKYRIEFADWTQVSLDTGKERNILRRPMFVSITDVAAKIYPPLIPLSAPEPVPLGWAPWDLVHPFEFVELDESCKEFKEVKGAMFDTLKKDYFTISKIYRIQSSNLWKEYRMRRTDMGHEMRGENVNEKSLFHGTYSINTCYGICTNNFDFRLSRENTTMYGKGTYFATQAKYSNCYTRGPLRFMFRARVLIGRYTKGEKDIACPPRIPGEGHKRFDSCVDNETNPSVFVVFDRNQSYPEHLIAYRGKDDELSSALNNPAPVSNPLSRPSSLRSLLSTSPCGAQASPSTLGNISQSAQSSHSQLNLGTSSGVDTSQPASSPGVMYNNPYLSSPSCSTTNLPGTSRSPSESQSFSYRTASRHEEKKYFPESKGDDSCSIQ